MNDFFEYFKNKKNFTNLLILAVVALSLPLVTESIKYQKVLFSRAAADPIVFSGPNVVSVNNQKVLKLNEQGRAVVDLELTSSLGPPVGANQQVDSQEIKLASADSKKASVKKEAINMSFIPKDLVGKVNAQSNNCSMWGDTCYCIEDSSNNYWCEGTEDDAGDGSCYVQRPGSCGENNNPGNSCPSGFHCSDPDRGGDAWCGSGFKCSVSTDCGLGDGCIYDPDGGPQLTQCGASPDGDSFCNENGTYPPGTYACDPNNIIEFADGCYTNDADSDGDGVNVPQDLCPLIQGTVQNNGCPGEEEPEDCSQYLLDDAKSCDADGGFGKWFCLDITSAPNHCFSNTDNLGGSECYLSTDGTWEGALANYVAGNYTDGQCTSIEVNPSCGGSLSVQNNSSCTQTGQVIYGKWNITDEGNGCSVSLRNNATNQEEVISQNCDQNTDLPITTFNGQPLSNSTNYQLVLTNNSNSCSNHKPSTTVTTSNGCTADNRCTLSVNNGQAVFTGETTEITVSDTTPLTFKLFSGTKGYTATWEGTNPANLPALQPNQPVPGYETVDGRNEWQSDPGPIGAGTYTRRAKINFANGLGSCTTGTYTINVTGNDQKPNVVSVTKELPNSKTQPYAPGSQKKVEVGYTNANHVDIYYLTSNAAKDPFPDNFDMSGLNAGTAFAEIAPGQGVTESGKDVIWTIPNLKPGKYYYVANAHTTPHVNGGINDWNINPSINDLGCAWDKRMYKQTGQFNSAGKPILEWTGESCPNFGPVEFWVGAGGAVMSPSPTPAQGTIPPGQRTPTPPPDGPGGTIPPGQRTPTPPPGGPGGTIPPGQRTPTPPPGGTNPPGGVRTISYKVAEDPNKLATAPSQPYTVEPTRITFPFTNSQPGVKTVFVEYLANTGATKREQASITVLGPDPNMTGCSLSFEGNGVTFNIVGQNFGEAGTIKTGQTNLTVVEWNNTLIKASLGNIQQNQNFPISIVNKAGQATTGACSSVSQLAFGARLFCRQPQRFDQDNVKIGLAGPVPGGKFTSETVTIDKDGIVQGLKSKLEAGKKYRLSIESPKSVRRSVEFTAAEGTSNLSNFILPVGDIFPLNLGDGTINVPDKSQLNREWIIASDAKDRSGDFNQDARVNSIDWACMRYDFGKTDDPEVTAGN